MRVKRPKLFVLKALRKKIAKKSKQRKTQRTPFSMDAACELMQHACADHFNGGAHLLYLTDKSFWHFNARCWSRVPDAWVSKKVFASLIRHPPSSKRRSALSLVKNGVSLLKIHRASKGDLLRLSTDPLPIINCRNGELWCLSDGSVELRKHRAKSYQRHCLAIDYDPNAKCPEYDAALAGIFSKAEDTQAMVRAWHEAVGYILQPNRRHAVILVLFGAGNNGKTRLVKTLIRLLGQEQVHSGRVEELESNRFILGNLEGKRLFVDDDVASDAKLSDGHLKKLSEMKELTGEKKFKDHFTFVSNMVPVLLCNHVPSLSDVSHGMLRRLSVIPFDRKFTSRTADATLFDRIWETELPGILNRAVQGLQRLSKRGHFKWPSDVVRAKRDWIKRANPLEAYIEEGCVRGPEHMCLLASFYQEYRRWADQCGVRAIGTKQTVHQTLKLRGFGTKKSNQGVKIIGLKLRGT